MGSMPKTQCIKCSFVMARAETAYPKEHKRFHRQDDVAGFEPNKIMVDGEGESIVPMAQS